MDYIKATSNDISRIFALVQNTIKTVYPKYYPKKVVEFFCKLHNKENIIADIENGYVYILLYDNRLIGTGTHKGNHITSVFVLPEYQRQGHGGYIMRQLEKEIEMTDTAVYLDASLAACILYEHRGYKTVKHEQIVVDDEILIYEKMKKELKNNGV